MVILAQVGDAVHGLSLQVVVLILSSASVHSLAGALFFVLAENEQRRYIGPFLVNSVGKSAVFHQVAFEVLIVDQVRNGQKPSGWVFN